MLKSISENELMVEDQRVALCEHEEFEPYSAFKRIGGSNIDKISARDISQFLVENNVDYISEVECFYLFKVFDKDEDGFLDFDE